MIDEKVTKWRKDGKHLPKFFRDFHDQKDLIAAMHHYTCKEDVPEMKDINLMNGHVYVVDFFLWFMARHGYTLQKTRKELPFEDIEKNIDSFITQRRDQFFNALKGQENGKD